MNVTTNITGAPVAHLVENTGFITLVITYTELPLKSMNINSKSIFILFYFLQFSDNL